jgi:hypothetical protein
LLSTLNTGTNDHMASRKDGSKSGTEKTEDETAPVLMKKSGDETAPVDPADLAKLTKASSPDAETADEQPTVPATLTDSDATPPPMAPVSRQRTATLAAVPTTDHGRPPEMPTTSAPPPLALGAVEDPTHMPGPRDIPSGEPSDKASSPGNVPPGDSRSLRRENDFALIYRVGTYVISRTGAMGTRGQWRVVEYPTSSSASHSYAKECSRFVSEGFSDYRS